MAMDATEWVVRALRRVLRADATLAGWAGMDAENATRIYHRNPPPLSVITGGGSTSYRYIVFFVVAPSEPVWDFAESRHGEALVQINAVDGTDGNTQHVFDAHRYIADVLEPPSTATLDHATVSDFETMRVTAATDVRDPESEDGKVWMATRDWRIMFRKA